MLGRAWALKLSACHQRMLCTYSLSLLVLCVGEFWVGRGFHGSDVWRADAESSVVIAV